MFYSHKNYMRPELQHDIHRHFDDEVRVVHLLYGGLWWNYVFNLSMHLCVWLYVYAVPGLRHSQTGLP